MCPCKLGSSFFSDKFQIRTLLSNPPEIRYLLSLVSDKLDRVEVYPFKTVSCLLFKRFQSLIVQSPEPETMNLLSLVTATLFTQDVCP